MVLFETEIFPKTSDLSKGIVLAPIGNDEFGVPMYLLCLGFHPSLKDRCLHFFYAKVKISDSGKLYVLEEFSKPYTDELKKRQDINNDGSLKFENGEPVMIGIFSFWENGLGYNFIYPDLQDTLDALAETYPN